MRAVCPRPASKFTAASAWSTSSLRHGVTVSFLSLRLQITRKQHCLKQSPTISLEPSGLSLFSFPDKKSKTTGQWLPEGKRGEVVEEGKGGQTQAMEGELTLAEHTTHHRDDVYRSAHFKTTYFY